MTIFQLPKKYLFPPIKNAEADGLLAFGGDLEPGRLLAAYSKGIFPWYSKGDPILWWFTDPRMVVFPEEFHIPKRVMRYKRKSAIEIRYDTNFTGVIHMCSEHRIESGDETWIMPEMITAYIRLHRLGYAHSVECWLEDRLVGGLYGVELGSIFYGESMVSQVTHASQFALIALVDILQKRRCRMIDCQMTTQYLQRFGGREISGDEFVEQLKSGINALDLQKSRGIWNAISTDSSI